MPTPKENLKATVEATRNLFVRAKELQKVDAHIRQLEAQQRAQSASTTSGETEPSD